MTIRDNFPLASPSILFDFKKNKKLDPRITFSRNDASSCATYFDASGVLRIAPPNFPRFDYDPLTLEFNGIQVEDSRTNSIRNNTMVGAAAGTPGTPPTNWSISIGGGLSRQIIETGVENGVNYIDIRIYGTATNTNLLMNLVFETSPTTINATNNQVWSQSAWVRMVGGSTNGVSYIYHQITEFNGSLTVLDYNVGVNFLSTITSNLRREFIFTTNQSTTAHIQPSIWVGHAGIGAVIDITFRIGLPQLELGSTVSSVIVTSGSSQQRLADTLSMDQLAPWYNPYEGTLYSEWKRGYTGNFINYASGAIITDDLTSSSSHIASGVLNGNNSQAIYAGMAVNGTSQLTYVAETAQINNKTALAYATNNTQQFTNKVAETPDTSCTVPSGLIKLRMGSNSTAQTFLNGWLRRIVYYPNRLTQNHGIAITT